jgi:hypothetical protein
MGVSTTIFLQLDVAPTYLFTPIMIQRMSTLDAMLNSGLNVKAIVQMPPLANYLVPSILGIMMGGMKGNYGEFPSFPMMG